MRFIIIFFIFFLSVSLSIAQNTRVAELNTKMETYDFGDPDPVPHPENLYYPYFRFDGFSDEKIDKEWKTVELENDYIKVTLFPEIGGKVWGAVDKVNNKEFIYHNHVVKFRDIAMRGAWVSGGVEFNFGIIGHAPTSSTPVDYVTRQKEDGSVSCYISSFEFITRTMWTVEVNLPKDKGYFSTNTTWYNNSSVDQPYYQWMNAGYKAEGDAQFCYPGTHEISHGGDASTFPIDAKGRDLSWYKKLDFEGNKSYHVLGKYNDFYGIYWHNDNHGSVHYSPYDEKLGAKIFAWSLSEEGAIWEDLLTDTDGQYIELQSGRMYNQPSGNSGKTPFRHASFLAGQTDAWSELWYPVANIKGITKASPLGALNVVRQNDSLKLYMSPLENVSTTIKLYVDEVEVMSAPVSFRVLDTWETSIPMMDRMRDGKLKIVIGNNALVYSEKEEDNVINRPLSIPKDFDWNSAYGLYTSGEQWMKQKIFTKAEIDLKESLNKDFYFMPAIIRLASLYYQQGKYNEALILCKRALSLNAYEGEANYLYGLCNMRLGKHTDAKDGFAVATHSLTVRSVAYAKLAGMYMIEKDWVKAESYALQSLNFNAENMEALNELLVCYRMLNNDRDFVKLSKQLVEKYPLNHFIRYEIYANGSNKDGEHIFKSLIRNELPHETYMELASWYQSVGCDKDAIALLSMASEYPLACYQKAYILHMEGQLQQAKECIDNADLLSPNLVFAFRPESMEALTWASSMSQSWKPRYYQAMLTQYLGDKRGALKLLQSVNKSDYPAFYLYRASLEKGEPRLLDLTQAQKLSSDWRIGLELIKYHEDAGNWAEANKLADKYNTRYPQNYVIGLKYATTLNEVKKYDACIKLLSNIKVLPNEGAYTGRALYREAYLNKAIDALVQKQAKSVTKLIESSKQWRENLGVGKPYDYLIDYRVENYIEALAANDKKIAFDLLTKISETYNKDIDDIQSADLLTAIALRQVGKEKIADQWVQSWKHKQGDKDVIEWCMAIYAGSNPQGYKPSRNKKNVDDDTPWERVSTDYNIKLIVKLFEALDAN